MKPRKNSIAILYRDELKEYDFGEGHPFRGDRAEIFPKFLKEKLPENKNYKILKAEPSTEEDLLLICQKDYIDFTKEYYRAANLGRKVKEDKSSFLPFVATRVFNGKFFQYHSMDNFPGRNPGKIEEAARIIIGQAKLACEIIQQGEFQKVISLGGGLHHAKENFGEGFCLYNDVAFTGKYLMEKYSLGRILILDTDAHAGNGTCEYFYEDPRVLFIDLHQDPRTLYPGTGFANEIGTGEGRGYTINVPLPPFAGNDSYKLVFEEIVEPVVREFHPQIIIRNGGSDPYFSDELTQLGLTIKGFEMIGKKVKEMAEICDGKEIDMIGSGYNKKVLPYAWLALISGLTGLKVETKELISIPQRFKKDLALEETKKVITEVKSNLKSYWSGLR